MDPQAGFLGYAVMGLTPLVFDASASSGDGLTFVFEFGDGEYTREPRVVHPAMRTGRSLRASVVTTDRFGRFDRATLTFGPVGTLADTQWNSDYFFNPTNGKSEGRHLYFRSHEGRAVSGAYIHPDDARSQLSGTFDGASGIELTLHGGGITFKGRLVPPVPPFYPPYNMELTLRGGSADGVTLRFFYYDGPG